MKALKLIITPSIILELDREMKGTDWRTYGLDVLFYGENEAMKRLVSKNLDKIKALRRED